MEQTPYSGMICAYLDGELDVTSDESLFSALATSPELRSEMREHLSIRSAVHSDVEAFTPPVAAAHTIFSSVGLDYPAAPPQEKRKTFGFLWLKFWRPVAVALLLSAITGSAVGFWYEQKLGDVLAAGALPPANRVAYILQSAPNAAEGTMLSLAEQQRGAPVGTMATHPSQTTVYIPASLNTSPQATIPPAQEYPVNSGNTEQLTALASASELQKHQPNVPASATPPPARNVRSSQFSPVELYPQFWMQTRGISTLHSSAPLPASGVSVIDNLGIAAGYKLSGAFSIGIEGGRECYPLQYSGTTEGVQLNYRQYAPLVFGGIMAQLSLKPLQGFGDLAPFATVSGGGTEIGPYFRGTLGVIYPVSEQMSFMLGGDISGVFYDFQQHSFQSWKSGLTYGLLFQF